MSCDAKIRPMPAPSVELTCESQLATPHDAHFAILKDYAFPGSAIQVAWFEDDRRNFRGDWSECPERGCVLPAGHPRGHAL